VDRYWTLWQKLCPGYATAYGGRNANGATARTSDTIIDSRSTIRITVADMMNLNGNYCVEYGPADSDTTLTCPSATRTTTTVRPTVTSTLPTSALDTSSDWLPLNLRAIVKNESNTTLRRRSDTEMNHVHDHGGGHHTMNSWNCSLNYQNYAPELYNKNVSSCKILMPPYTRGMADMDMCEFELRLTDNHLLASIDFYNQVGQITRAKPREGC
jgi:hypothetical protein